MSELDPSRAKGLDKKFVLLQLQLEAEIQRLSRSRGIAMNKEVMKMASANGIRDADTLTTRLIKSLREYFTILDATILQSVEDISKARAADGYSQFVPTLQEVTAFEEARRFINELSAFPESVKKSFPYHRHGPDNNSYSGRIKSIQDSAEKTVRNIIANALTDGSSARAIAAKIQNYVIVRPDQKPTRPYDEYRQRFSRPTSVTPGSIRAGTIASNSMMVARTETAEMYRDATERLYGSKKWVIGYRWVLSNSHPKLDICDALANKGVYDKNDSRPWSHPHCVCDWQAEPVSQSEFRAMVDRGELK